MANNKTPRASKKPNTDKKVRQPVAAISTDGFSIGWHLSTVDWEGPWGWRHVDHACFWGRIHKKLGSFETMTWNDLGRQGSHQVPVKNLCKDAKDRLTEIKQDDIDELFSLRLKGTERIWGIRDRNFLKVLWWDPEHEVYPSFKKHT